jgi:hypothetical protein
VNVSAVKETTPKQQNEHPFCHQKTWRSILGGRGELGDRYMRQPDHLVAILFGQPFEFLFASKASERFTFVVRLESVVCSEGASQQPLLIGERLQQPTALSLYILLPPPPHSHRIISISSIKWRNDNFLNKFLTGFLCDRISEWLVWFLL